MQRVIGRPDEHLAFEELERIPAGMPTAGDVLLRVTLKLQVARGEAEVWVERPAVERFARELCALVEAGAGEARFESMSPGELVLELAPCERPDALGLTAQLGAHRLSGGTTWFQRVAGGFELEHSHVRLLLEAFEALLAPPR